MIGEVLPVRRPRRCLEQGLIGGCHGLAII